MIKQEKKKKTKPILNSYKNLMVLKKTVKMVMDDSHIIGCGTVNDLQQGVLGDFFFPISFTFDYLKRAENYYKSIHGDLYDESRIKCMVPNKHKAPMIFIYTSKEVDQIFCIAPRFEDLANSNIYKMMEKKS